jgi:thymidylate kinase
MTVLIAVTGAAPGMGKSTICAGLHRWLADAGMPAELFGEEDVFTRGEFADVAAEFNATGVAGRRTILASMADYVSAIQTAAPDVTVTDSLVPFTHSLLAWGHADETIAGFLAELAELLKPVHPVIIYLDGDPRIALKRAADRDGPGWLGWFIGKLVRYQVQPAVSDFETACAYLERERETTLRLLRGGGWRVIVIDGADSLPVSAVLDGCRDGLRPLLTRTAGSPGVRQGLL